MFASDFVYNFESQSSLKIKILRDKEKKMNTKYASLRRKNKKKIQEKRNLAHYGKSHIGRPIGVLKKF